MAYAGIARKILYIPFGKDIFDQAGVLLEENLAGRVHRGNPAALLSPVLETLECEESVRRSVVYTVEPHYAALFV
jgi:hypothetical protein